MSAAMITVDRVHKSFGSQTVLDGISFEVARGETVAVLGRSGTGKSVLLKNIIGLMDPDAGRIEVMGRSFVDMKERQRLRWRRQLGYVFQGAALFDSLRVWENVGFTLIQDRRPDGEIRERVQQRLEMVGLGHAIDKLPSELSGGMQKRVGLARAIIEEPDIILYDEPTSGLDPLTTDVINQIILRLRSKLGVTSVVVTHDIRSAFTIADRVIMLDNGHIIAQGTPSQIENSDNPWVQHFIAGRALENEVHDGSRLRIERTGSGTGLRPVVRRGDGDGPLDARPPVVTPSRDSTRIRTAIRVRRRSSTVDTPALPKPPDQRPRQRSDDGETDH